MILETLLGITKLLQMRSSHCESLLEKRLKSKWRIAADVEIKNPFDEVEERLELMNPGEMQDVLSMQFRNHWLYHYDVFHCDNRLFSGTDNSQCSIIYDSPEKPDRTPQPF